MTVQVQLRNRERNKTLMLEVEKGTLARYDYQSVVLELLTSFGRLS